MTRALSNPQATPAARRLYDYLCSLQGHGCLTGQMESVWCGTPEHEMNYLLNRTGRLPAIRGLDFIDNDFAGVVRRAMEWHARGGIVTICWHTGPDCRANTDEWEPVLLSAALELLGSTHCARELSLQPSTHEMRRKWVIEDYIERHYTDTTGMDGLAQALYLSQLQTRKLVRRFLGEDFKSIIIRRRMELAEIYLYDHRTSLEEMEYEGSAI